MFRVKTAAFFRESMIVPLLAVPWVIALPSTAPTPPVVKITGGEIQGNFEPSPSVVAYFKGIPFAQPPVMNLRWQEPQPLQPWKGVREATHFGPACMQDPLGTALFVGPMMELYDARGNLAPFDVSEDCLFLNVWTAQWPPAKLLPVMVWIHGGANMIGSGGEAAYDGSALARKGVVVVTLNYRLGVFGFFEHPDLTRESPHRASGNYGLLDQISALQWVQQNITQFGGDPHNVTVFGQSAGSVDIGVLMGSPLAAGLFQRVLLESGPVLSVAPHAAPLSVGEQFGEKVARALGPAGDLQSLRSAPAAAVFHAYAEVTAHEHDPGFVQDGWCVRASPTDVFAESKQLPVDMMIGNNGREMSAFRVMAAKHPQAPGGPDTEALKRTMRIFYGGATALVAGMFLLDTTLRRTDAADSWLNDAIASCPAMAMAALHSSPGHHVYVYRFLRSIPGKGQDTLGSFHGLELPYVFGSFDQPAWNWLPFQAVDFKLGELIRDYWTNFAKTGNPNGPDLPGWQAYEDNSSESVMEFDNDGKAASHAGARPTFCDVNTSNLKNRLSQAFPSAQ